MKGTEQSDGYDRLADSLKAKATRIYCTVTVTTPELVTCRVGAVGGGVVDAELPPQALRNTGAVSRIMAVRTGRRTLFADAFSQIDIYGSSRIEKSATALAATGPVSVNTIVTW
jgi:hypothetical protein